MKHIESNRSKWIYIPVMAFFFLIICLINVQLTPKNVRPVRYEREMARSAIAKMSDILAEESSSNPTSLMCQSFILEEWGKAIDIPEVQNDAFFFKFNQTIKDTVSITKIIDMQNAAIRKNVKAQIGRFRLSTSGLTLETLDSRLPDFRQKLKVCASSEFTNAVNQMAK